MDELQKAQQRISRALNKARAGDDPKLAALVRERGEQLVNLFKGLLRMSQIHSPDNRAFDQPVAELQRSIAGLFELIGTIHLVAIEDQAYVNQLRVRTNAAGGSGRDLSASLAVHNVGGITFNAVPTEPQVRKLLGCFNQKPAASSPRAALQKALQAAGVDSVEVEVLHRFRMAGEELEEDEAPEEESPPQVAARTIRLVEELWDNLAAKRQTNALPLRRAAAQLLRIGPGHELFWDDLPHATPHGLHAFRVAQLALIAGQAAGLSQAVLQDLGVAALLHDAGYAALNLKPGHPPDPALLAQAPRHHPVHGARLLLTQPGFHEAKVRRALGALEHHRDFNDPSGRPTLFGRVLRIAEDFETLQRRAAGHLSPPMALACMVSGAGTRYDPVLLQLLINRLGYYPPRTVMRLEDGRIVRAVSLVRTPQTFAAPLAVVLRDAAGKPPPARQIIDLAREGRVKGLLQVG
ncbi:MAG: HD-GYP domain-containing protein [Myxococcales bacterium]